MKKKKSRKMLLKRAKTHLNRNLKSPKSRVGKTRTKAKANNHKAAPGSTRRRTQWSRSPWERHQRLKQLRSFERRRDNVKVVRFTFRCLIHQLPFFALIPPQIAKEKTKADIIKKCKTIAYVGLERSSFEVMH